MPDCTWVPLLWRLPARHSTENKEGLTTFVHTQLEWNPDIKGYSQCLEEEDHSFPVEDILEPSCDQKKKSIINFWPFEAGCSLPPFPKLTLLTFGNMCFVWWQNTALESGVLSQSLVWEQSQASRQLLSLQEQMGWIIFWRAVRSKTEEDAVQLTEVQNC